KKSLAIQPNNNEALLGLSSIYEKTGNPRQAQEYLKKAVELASSNTGLILGYAESLLKAKSFSEAMQCISKITKIEPSNIAARKLLGEMYAESVDKQKAWGRMLKEALECYKEASEIHSDDNELKEKITDIKRELGEECIESKK
ncbi:MAG: tetratricopeptide repeat protein, partial [Thermodesulfovibrionales bacterium]|nr:tetratricopeptide repeat protein [Thermodesulfovibrionales bacterium]